MYVLIVSSVTDPIVAQNTLQPINAVPNTFSQFLETHPELECHVGISGRTVHPKDYIACGISEASQHISGMRDSQMIIAINKDPNAPIFRIAHCGVVGDLLEIIPALLEDAVVY